MLLSFVCPCVLLQNISKILTRLTSLLLEAFPLTQKRKKIDFGQKSLGKGGCGGSDILTY